MFDNSHSLYFEILEIAVKIYAMKKANITTISINEKWWRHTYKWKIMPSHYNGLLLFFARILKGWTFSPRIRYAFGESHVVGPQKGVGTDHRSGYILVSGAGVRDVGWHWPREQPPLGVLAGAWKRRLRFVDTLARPGCRKKGRRGKTQYDPGRSRGSGVTVHEGFRLSICWAIDSAVVVGQSWRKGKMGLA